MSAATTKAESHMSRGRRILEDPLLPELVVVWNSSGVDKLKDNVAIISMKQLGYAEQFSSLHRTYRILRSVFSLPFHVFFTFTVRAYLNHTLYRGVRDPSSDPGEEWCLVARSTWSAVIEIVDGSCCLSYYFWSFIRLNIQQGGWTAGRMKPEVSNILHCPGA